MAKKDAAPKSSKSTRKPKSADVGTPAIEMNPHLADRPGVEEVVRYDELPEVPPIAVRPIEVRPERVEAARIALNDLDELLANTATVHQRAAPLLADAQKRLKHVRSLLGC